MSTVSILGGMILDLAVIFSFGEAENSLRTLSRCDAISDYAFDHTGPITTYPNPFTLGGCTVISSYERCYRPQVVFISVGRSSPRPPDTDERTGLSCWSGVGYIDHTRCFTSAGSAYYFNAGFVGVKIGVFTEGGSYTIKLLNDANPPASGVLAEVEPGKATTTLRATVYDSNNQSVSNVNVKLEVTVETNSGGHQHDVDRHKGLLSNGISAGVVIEGNTSSGNMPFTFHAPAPAGDHKIKAACTGGQAYTQEGPDKVRVMIKDLVSLYELGRQQWTP